MSFKEKDEKWSDSKKEDKTVRQEPTRQSFRYREIQLVDKPPNHSSGGYTPCRIIL